MIAGALPIVWQVRMIVVSNSQRGFLSPIQFYSMAQGFLNIMMRPHDPRNEAFGMPQEIAMIPSLHQAP